MLMVGGEEVELWIEVSPLYGLWQFSWCQVFSCRQYSSLQQDEHPPLASFTKTNSSLRSVEKYNDDMTLDSDSLYLHPYSLTRCRHISHNFDLDFRGCCYGSHLLLIDLSQTSATYNSSTSSQRGSVVGRAKCLYIYKCISDGTR